MAEQNTGQEIYTCSRLWQPVTTEIDELARVWAAVFGSCRFRRKNILKKIFTADTDGNVIITARSNKKIIGFIHLQAGQDNTVWHNRGNGVLSPYRRRGVGRKLLQSAINFARRQKSLAVVSHVDKANTSALALHLQLGFKKDCPPPGRCPELRYRLLLEF